MSQYRLKKPLPDYEAGAIISKEDNEYYRFDNPLPGGYRPRYSIAYVENNSDWFEKIEPKHPLLELLERESNEFVNWSNRVSFDKAINIVRNYLQSQPLFCEEVKGEESITLKKIEQIYDEYVFQVPYDGSQQYYNQEKIDAVKPFFELLKKHIMSSVISNSKKEINADVFQVYHKHLLLVTQARAIHPNAGDSYYVELGKLLDKHLREERG